MAVINVILRLYVLVGAVWKKGVNYGKNDEKSELQISHILALQQHLPPM